MNTRTERVQCSEKILKLPRGDLTFELVLFELQLTRILYIISKVKVAFITLPGDHILDDILQYKTFFRDSDKTYF